MLDDEPSVLRATSRMLGAKGFDVASARSEREAFDALASRGFDLVLLDVHLGPACADGLSLISRLRSSGWSGPVIVLSGDDSFERAHDAARLGAAGYLVKGGFEKLPGLIASVLSSERNDSPLSTAAEAYLRTRGLSGWDLDLLRDFSLDFERVKEISRRLGRNEAAVRKQFQDIRDKLGASSQADLARILGVLSCFASTARSDAR